MTNSKDITFDSEYGIGDSGTGGCVATVAFKFIGQDNVDSSYCTPSIKLGFIFLIYWSWKWASLL